MMDTFETMLDSQAQALAKECMDPTVIYAGIGALFVLGALLFQNTSIHAGVGGTEYERRRRRRFAGITLMAAALICAGTEMYSQSNGPGNDIPPALLEKARQEAWHSRPAPSPAFQPSSNASASSSPSATANQGQSSSDRAKVLLREAAQLLQQRMLDSALDKANEAIAAAQRNPAGYCLRGNIYAEKGLWNEASQDYQTVLQFDANNKQVKFDMAELQFMQKKYDDARPGFAALGSDSDLGDLATYKVFLCDLLGGHDETASKEFDSFNQADSNASYYFANVAWYLYHQKTEEARKWLLSAAKIYEPHKLSVYSSSLVDLGYLPLPPPAQK